MFVFDKVLDVALAPSLARAADIFELILNLEEATIDNAFVDRIAKKSLVMPGWMQKINDLARNQTYMSFDAFLDEAELIAYQRIEERKGIIRERFRLKQERAEQRSLELMQEAREENLIRMGVYA